MKGEMILRYHFLPPRCSDVTNSVILLASDGMKGMTGWMDEGGESVLDSRGEYEGSAIVDDIPGDVVEGGCNRGWFFHGVGCIWYRGRPLRCDLSPPPCPDVVGAGKVVGSGLVKRGAGGVTFGRGTITGEEAEEEESVLYLGKGVGGSATVDDIPGDLPVAGGFCAEEPLCRGRVGWVWPRGTSPRCGPVPPHRPIIPWAGKLAGFGGRSG